MVAPHSTGDLYHKYRPRKFNEIAGHEEVVESVQRAMFDLERPKVYLLTGSTGTGKTSTARIMATALNCTSPLDKEPCLTCPQCKSVIAGNCIDIMEVNAANYRGINDIRSICKTLQMLPMLLSYKVFILDECHQLTNDAQSSLLKVLEDAPNHVIFILCSTHPTKILPAVRNRCQRYNFNSLTRTKMLGLVSAVTTMEGQFLEDDVYDVVVESAGGSPRAALVSLQQVLQLDNKSPEAANRLLGNADETDGNVIKIGLAINNTRLPWSEVTGAYTEVKVMGPPAIGMVLAGFYRNQLLRAKTIGQGRLSSKRLSFFLSPFADGKLGENQLVHAMYLAKTSEV